MLIKNLGLLNLLLGKIVNFINNKKIISDSFFVGLINGTLLLLSGNTLNFWLTSEKVDIKTIGLMTLVALPYSFKYLLAPLIDNYNLPFTNKVFSRNKSWIISSLFCCIILLIIMSFQNPHYNLKAISIVAFLIAMCSVILDLSLNSYRIYVFADRLNISSTSYVCGYRIGILISGAGSIYFAEIFSWKILYLSLAALCTVFLLVMHLSTSENFTNHSKNHNNKSLNFSLYNCFILPFAHLGNIKNILLIFTFLILYRLPDNMIIVVINPLYMSLGFDGKQIASYSRFIGFFFALLGTIVTGFVIKKKTLQFYLIRFLIIHSFTHLLYLPLIYVANANIPLLAGISIVHAFTGGIVLTIYISYMSSLCKGENIAIQYAVLFSLMGFARTFIPSFSGYITSYTNWYTFFILMTLINIPTILIFSKLKNK